MQKAASLAIVLISLAALLELWRRGLPLWDEAGPGPSFFPAVLSAVLLGLGVLFGRARREAASEEPDDGAQSYAASSQTLKFAVLLAGLIVLFPRLGALPSLSLFVFAEMLWVEKSAPWVAVLSGFAAFAAIWLIFVWLLSVPLPSGILPAGLS